MRRLLCLLPAAAVAAAATLRDISCSGTSVAAAGDGFTSAVFRYTLGFAETAADLALAPVTGQPGRWAAQLPPTLPAGQLLRGAVLAFSGGAQVAALPVPDSVVNPTAISSQSQVPTLFWFVRDAAAARSDVATPGAVFFDARDGRGLVGYGNTTAHRSGSERHEPKANMWARGKSKDWAKRNYKLSFRGHQRFVWRAGATPVRAIELHAGFVEAGPVSYMRKHLAHQFMAALGVPVAQTGYVRVWQNGAFLGLYLFTTLIDRSFLAGVGLDTQGRLFKAAHWKYSNLRPPQPGWECPFTAPDADYWPRGEGKCPVIFAESLRNGSSHLGELEALATAIARGDLSAFDLPAVVTEMAAQTAMLNQDRCTKNHFYHKARSGRWTVIPYDLKDAFASDNRGSGRDCAALGAPCSNAETYCLLSCDAFNSPFFCDALHPQDTFPESDGRSTFNHLVDAVLKDPAARALYLAKLRAVMDTYLSAGWLQGKVAETRALIAQDARADNAKWGAGDIDAGVAALLAQMATRRAQLYGRYGYLWPSGGMASSRGPVPAASQARLVAASGAEEAEEPAVLAPAAGPRAG